jgi:uncharacterized protein (DUF488 family)
VEIYTIGFARRTAEGFFEPLKRAGIEQLVDVRLHNVSQLAGFTKKADLPYFLRSLADIDYRHELLLAPEEEFLRAYRSKEIDWETYAQRYLELLAERAVAKELRPSEFPDKIALLCSEARPDKCHRRVAAEYLQANWPDVTIKHM